MFKYSKILKFLEHFKIYERRRLKDLPFYENILTSLKR